MEEQAMLSKLGSQSLFRYFVWLENGIWKAPSWGFVTEPVSKHLEVASCLGLYYTSWLPTYLITVAGTNFLLFSTS